MISAAGNVDPGHILLLAEALFGDLQPAPAPRLDPARFAGGIKSDRRAAEQTHLAFAYAGVPASDPTAPALSLFAQAVGGGMSSRLFQELREERGLAYSIYSWTQGFADTGLFAVNLSADKARAAEAMALARDTVERAARNERGRAEACQGTSRGEHPDGARTRRGRAVPWPGRLRFLGDHDRRGNAGGDTRG